VPIWTHDDEVKEGGKFEISYGGGNYRTLAPKRILPKDGNYRTSAPKVFTVKQTTYCNFVLVSFQLTQHSWQSMKDHYLKIIHPNLKSYDLLPEVTKRLAQLLPSYSNDTRGKHFNSTHEIFIHICCALGTLGVQNQIMASCII
jgi:hypothetical protein